MVIRPDHAFWDERNKTQERDWLNVCAHKIVSNQ